MLTEILTVAKSTLQFCFISSGTTILRYIKRKKEQFRSKKSLNETNLHFDVFFSGIFVFSMKLIKRNETSGVLFLAEMVHSLIPLDKK